MIKLIPLLALALLIYLCVRHYRSLPIERKKPFLIKITVYTLIIVLLIATLTGRIHWLGAALAGLLGLLKFGASTFMRFLPFLRFFQRSKVFGDPVFKTPHLEITLSLESGMMTGKVIAGEFIGRDISSLNSTELDSLEAQLKGKDNRSYYLLRVIRQRATDQTSAEDFPHTDAGNISVDEARSILGLKEAFDKKDVDYAYKRLMQKLHPDRGGNDYLASRVNLARDVLLKHLGKP